MVADDLISAGYVSEITRVAQGQMEKPVMLEGAQCSVASGLVPENGGFRPIFLGDLPTILPDIMGYSGI